MDSNHDKQNQNLLCYRYTTGQFAAPEVIERGNWLMLAIKRRKATPKSAAIAAACDWGVTDRGTISRRPVPIETANRPVTSTRPATHRTSQRAPICGNARGILRFRWGMSRWKDSGFGVQERGTETRRHEGNDWGHWLIGLQTKTRRAVPALHLS